MRKEMKTRIEMISRGEVPEGYKKTKVGIIPEDWEVKRLGEVSNILRGASPRPISDPKWFDNNSNIGWVRISDVSNSNKILIKTEQYLSNKGIEKSRLVKRDNIIMSICATVGKPIYTGIDVCIHDGFVVFDELSLDKEFFYYMLSNKEKSWYRYGQTGSQMNLNTNIVENERVNIPIKIEEQQKIAQILSTWDQAIELKEKLIEEKKQQKKGLMQKLLTGEVRLPGFDGEWEEVRLGDIVKRFKGKAVDYDKNGNYPVIGIEYFETGIFENYSNDNTVIATEKDVLILWDGANAGKAFTSIKGIVGSTFVNLECKNVNNIYLQKHLELNEKFIMNIREGSGIPHVPKDFLSFYKLNLPSLQEQKAIAKILTTADKEIELLTQELEQLKLQKKGLMQLLLTGIIRVKS